MNIALIGPPGSKKSRVAKQMKDAIQLQDLGNQVHVLDNYVQKLQRETDLALGPFATWNENFMVAGVRRAAELKARQKYATVITVGTILDTMYYCGLASHAANSGQSQDPYATQLATTAAMGGIGLWFRTDWDYDLAFVIEHEQDDSWKTQYTRDIKPLAQSLGIPGLFRYETTEQFDAEVFVKVVQAAQDAEQRIRPGGETGEKTREPADDVPDMPRESD